jgi:protein-tyrosine phosphatase
MSRPPDGATPLPTVRLLFVCMGNICRSPTAEGVMRALVADAGLQDSIQLDSAGTGAWHVGSPPDERAAAVALPHAIVLDGRARQVRREDFDDFDLLLAMDRSNLRELRQQARGEAERAKVRLLREFDPASGAQGACSPAGWIGGKNSVPEGRVRDDLDVPDPYYGGAGGFDKVFELVHAACEGLLEQIRDASHQPAR